jgi:hypothetical protein
MPKHIDDIQEPQSSDNEANIEEIAPSPEEESVSAPKQDLAPAKKGEIAQMPPIPEPEEDDLPYYDDKFGEGDTVEQEDSDDISPEGGEEEHKSDEATVADQDTDTKDSAEGEEKVVEGESAEQSSGEDTVAHYKRLFEEERQKRNELQQAFTSRTFAQPQYADHSVSYTDPGVQQILHALESGDGEALARHDAGLVRKVTDLYQKAKANSSMAAFDPVKWAEMNVLPLVDQLVKYRLEERDRAQSFDREHGQYLKANSSRAENLAKELGTSDPKVLLRILQTEDKAKAVSTQRNSAEAKAKQGQRLVKETRGRLQGNGKHIKVNPSVKIDHYRENFGNSRVRKSAREIFEELRRASIGD